jgi:hypothetical protein
MTEPEKVVAAESITLSIMAEIDNSFLNGTENQQVVNLVETMMHELRPVIRRGAERWLGYDT